VLVKTVLEVGGWVGGWVGGLMGVTLQGYNHQLPVLVKTVLEVGGWVGVRGWVDGCGC
jgi:hypothetical protein